MQIHHDLSLGAQSVVDCIQHCTLVNIAAMHNWLKQYSKRTEAELITKGFQEGFVIPHSTSLAVVFTGNLKSVCEFLHVVQEKLDKEVKLNHMTSPFQEQPL